MLPSQDALPKMRSRDYLLTSRENNPVPDLKKIIIIKHTGTLVSPRISQDIINQFGVHFQDFYGKPSLLSYIRWEFLSFYFLFLLYHQYPLGGDKIIYFLRFRTTWTFMTLYERNIHFHNLNMHTLIVAS